MSGCCPVSGRRGLQKFTYTYRTLAEIFGVKPSTLRSYASQNFFDPEDLLSIFEFLEKRRKGEPFTAVVECSDTQSKQ